MYIETQSSISSTSLTNHIHNSSVLYPQMWMQEVHKYKVVFDYRAGSRQNLKTIEPCAVGIPTDSSL